MHFESCYGLSEMSKSLKKLLHYPCRYIWYGLFTKLLRVYILCESVETQCDVSLSHNMQIKRNVRLTECFARQEYYSKAV